MYKTNKNNSPTRSIYNYFIVCTFTVTKAEYLKFFTLCLDNCAIDITKTDIYVKRLGFFVENHIARNDLNKLTLT